MKIKQAEILSSEHGTSVRNLSECGQNDGGMMWASCDRGRIRGTCPQQLEESGQRDGVARGTTGPGLRQEISK